MEKAIELCFVFQMDRDQKSLRNTVICQPLHIWIRNAIDVELFRFYYLMEILFQANMLAFQPSKD